MLLGQTTTTTSIPATSASSITHLSGNDWIVALSLTVGLVIAAGIVTAASRSWLEGRTADAGNATQSGSARAPDRTLIRSWLAVSLAGGLLLFCAISFGLDDTTLRSTLIGGLVANAGAAIAFYFASKASDQARHDILTASFPSVLVPTLLGKNEHDVNAIMATTSLHLLARPPDRDPNAATIVNQNPAAGQMVPQSSPINVEFAGPVPDLLNPALTPSQAGATLQARNLILVKEPTDAGDDKHTTSQDPQPQADAPRNQKVTVTFA